MNSSWYFVSLAPAQASHRRVTIAPPGASYSLVVLSNSPTPVTFAINNALVFVEITTIDLATISSAHHLTSISVGAIDPAAIALAAYRTLGALRAVRRAVIAETTVLTHGIVTASRKAAVPFTDVGAASLFGAPGNTVVTGATRRAGATHLTTDVVAIIALTAEDAAGSATDTDPGGVTPNTLFFIRSRIRGHTTIDETSCINNNCGINNCGIDGQRHIEHGAHPAVEGWPGRIHL